MACADGTTAQANKAEVFGDFSQHKEANERFYSCCKALLSFPPSRENERHFILAAIRRTLSLSKSFQQSVETCNGQMAVTLVRLHLDTLARFYALYWADETAGMSAESFSKDVASGKSVKDMKLRGSNEKASDRWLIQQISGLGDWIKNVYSTCSGAVHFSDFHINQLLQQAVPKERFEDGSLQVQMVIGPGEKDADPEMYREIMQAFLHISLMLATAVEHRCGMLPEQT